MAQQTAIEWIKDMLEWNYGDPQMLEISWKNLDDLLERAKKMEKEHIINAWEDGKGAFSTRQAEQYYNEQYKK